MQLIAQQAKIRLHISFVTGHDEDGEYFLLWILKDCCINLYDKDKIKTSFVFFFFYLKDEDL